MTVDEFVAAEAARPFAWGVTDCCSTADRWLQTARGVSPISSDEWNGSREAAMECITHPYALPARVNRAMRRAGFRRTPGPKPGDIGLVLFDRRVCIAIRTSMGWSSRHEDGLVGAPIDNFWKAWAV
ncbi:DUF6950 family protein [Allomesorhizobium camelthorni]|uniref:DUF6950 family protein n=1 Tax=Allomesorhizobium camelthorni TaxID=475069 RepID=UPI003CCCAC57